MSEIRTLTRNGDVFFPLTHSDAVIGMNEFRESIMNQVENYRPIEITGNVTNAPDEEERLSLNATVTANKPHSNIISNSQDLSLAMTSCLSSMSNAHQMFRWCFFLMVETEE